MNSAAPSTSPGWAVAASPCQEQRRGRGHHQRHANGHRLAGREAQESDLDDVGLAHRVQAHPRTGDQKDRVADQQAQADGDQRHGDRASAAQRPKQAEMGQHREHGRGEHAARGGHDQVLMQPDIDHQGDVRADGQVVTVGEVGDTLDAEDERGADTGERQDGAGDEPVDRELCELLKHETGGLRY
jgi:hypothetical protein